MRWSHSSTPSAAWIPGSVAFCARGDLVWAGARGAAGTRLLVLDGSALGAGPPRFEDTALFAGATHVATVAGRRTQALFSVAQVPAPTKHERRTLVARHDPVVAARDGSFEALWVHDAGLITNGPARIAADEEGEVALLAIWDSTGQRVQLDRLDGRTGALLGRALLPGAALNALDAAADGSRVAVAAGLDLYVLDGQGTVLHGSTLAAATPALSLSGDGTLLAVGGAGGLTLRSDAASWAEVFRVPAPSHETAVRADLSHDGGVLAIGWWDASAGTDARLEVWDTTSRTRVNHHVSSGAGALQNLPEAVRVTPDGRRVAFGTWGDGSTPEALLFETGEDVPVLVVDAPGSVRALDLDESGTRLAVAYEDGHANELGSTGGVLLAQTGEAEITRVGAAAIGAELRVALRLPGASLALLLIGERAEPAPVAGVHGLLLLDRSSLELHVRRTAQGRADFALAIPDDPAWIGTQQAMQAGFRLPGGTSLGTVVIEPLILGR